MSGPVPRLTLVMIARMPANTVMAFREYERRVLALLDRHGGILERRLRATDDSAEIHVLSFETRDGYRAYLDDPDRAVHRELLDGLPIEQHIVEVSEVGHDD
jgi:uncharacterized protein (DUF1330 family)